MPLAQLSDANPPGSAISDSEWRTPAACLQSAAETPAPIVWLGACEPLAHPNIAEVASALAAKEHYVFLHTTGNGFRKRIHEFQPVPCFYLTFEIPVHSSDSSDSANSPDSSVSIQTVSECIRTARLSGFYVCGHFTIGEDTPFAQVAARIQELSAHHLDGFAMSSRGVGASEFAAPSTPRLGEFTRLIPSLGWRAFSRALESSYHRHAPSHDLAVARSPAENACEESA